MSTSVTENVKSIGSDIADSAAALAGFKSDVVIDNWTKRLTLLALGTTVGAVGTSYLMNRGMTKAKVAEPVRQAIKENTFGGSLLVRAA